MEKIFFYFLKSSLDDQPMKDPYVTSEKIGEIGDFIELDGQGYYIEDYAEEIFGNEQYEGESLYW